MRLIDADKIPYVDLSDGRKACFVAFADKINQMPTIEPERKKGKWGEHGECPFCDYLRQWRDDKFCANCGAKMEEENV